MDTSALNWSEIADDLDGQLLSIRKDIDDAENKLGHHIL
jgi:hypothetical protein